MEHLKAAEPKFLQLLDLTSNVLLNVNYYAADKGKSLVCRVIIEGEIILSAYMRDSAEFNNKYFQLIFTQFIHEILFP